MKKIIVLISILLGISIISYGIYANLLKNKENIVIQNEEVDNIPSKNESLAIMIETDKGYEKWNDDSWPGEGYVFNKELSKCANGNTISYDESTKKIIMNGINADNCYVYFDKYVLHIEENIQLLTNKAKSMNATEQGELIQHTQDEPNGANDGGYRYSGNNPNNFICFGLGSEDYNNGEPGAICDPKNQYRIIGIVPVTKEDGNTESLVKVIKSEYINETELGLTASSKSLSVYSSYAKSPRIKTTSGIHGFYWNGSSSNSSNQWSNSTLKEALNNHYLNTTLGEEYSNKIETVQWNVGGYNSYGTASAMKAGEESSSSKENAKIGLMYVYDYGFASAKKNWGTRVDSYDNDKNRNANWLFNGVYEWTISRFSSLSSGAFFVHGSGDVLSYGVSDDSFGVRPVFYLKSNVEIKSDGADGSSAHPFRVQ